MKIIIILIVGYLAYVSALGTLANTLEANQKEAQADRVALIDAAFNQ